MSKPSTERPVVDEDLACRTPRAREPLMAEASARGVPMLVAVADPAGATS